MATSAQADEGLFADINVTPLVDVTLVLLIIFMVAAPLMMTSPSIKVELPKAATGDETPRTTLAITLQRRQPAGYTLFLNGERADDAGLLVRVPALLAGGADVQAIVSADRGVAYGDVMHVVDLVKALGIRKFALSTEPAP